MKKIIFIITGLIAGCTAFSQKFTASVDKSKVTVGEIFQVHYTLNASGKNFSPPSFSDFTVHSGPNHSTSMQIINGNISQSLTLSYYLSAKKEGTFTIGSASIDVGGNKIESNPVTIEVVKGGASTQGQQQGGQQKPQQTVPVPSENLFAKTSVSKTIAVNGEQIIIVHKVYFRANLKDFRNIRFPSYNGFWVNEMPIKGQYEVSTENVDGVPFNVVEIKKAVLFPQRTGKLEIEPVVIECIVREKSGKRTSPWEQFFGHDPFFQFDAYKDVVYEIKSNRVSIEVKPLPEAGKPKDFAGAVGNFSMNASLDKNKVKANEGVNLKISISGKGNLQLVELPQIVFPDNIETYDPKTTENITAGTGGVSGSKTFEQLLIPRTEGVYKIEPWTFSFYDPEKQKYITLPSPEFTLMAEKGDASAAVNPVFSSVAKEDIKILGSDIRHIKTGNIILTKKDEHFFTSPLFIAGFSVPPVLFLLFLFLRHRHIQQNSNPVLVRKRKANRLAGKQLASARNSMRQNNAEDFYNHILSAMYHYIANKTNLPVAELNKEKITELFAEKNIPKEISSGLIALLDTAEFARYAPGSSSASMEDILNRAENILLKMEEHIA